jgi:hypothetical protein
MPNTQPRILIQPLKPAVIAGVAQKLPVLIRVQAPDAAPTEKQGTQALPPRPGHRPFRLDVGPPLIEAVRCTRHIIEQLEPTTWPRWSSSTTACRPSFRPTRSVTARHCTWPCRGCMAAARPTSRRLEGGRRWPAAGRRPGSAGTRHPALRRQCQCRRDHRHHGDRRPLRTRRRAWRHHLDLRPRIALQRGPDGRDGQTRWRQPLLRGYRKPTSSSPSPRSSISSRPSAPARSACRSRQRRRGSASACSTTIRSMAMRQPGDPPARHRFRRRSLGAGRTGSPAGSPSTAPGTAAGDRHRLDPGRRTAGLCRCHC